MTSSEPDSCALVAEHLAKEVSSADARLRILDAVNLRVPAGQTLSIVGTSGAGKSTLLALLAGLDTPSHGHVQLLGQPLGALDEDARAALRSGRVGFVFQSFQLIAGMSALENVMLPMELAGRRDARERAAETLDQVGLGQRLRHAPNQLSGGEQQRVALARAFAIRPRILFADEPTGNLDDATSDQVAELLFRLNSEHQTTLVLVTHDRRLAAHCARRTVLRDGRLHDDAPA